MGLVRKPRRLFSHSTFEMLGGSEGGQMKPLCVFCSNSQQWGGGGVVLWGEAKSDEGIEDRKEGSAPSASQNYQDAACAVGAGTGP